MTFADLSMIHARADRNKCPSTQVSFGCHVTGWKPKFWRTELLNLSTRKNSLALTAIVGVALVLGACQSMGGGEKEMAKPINCSTAKPDIATLQKERASVLREMGAGVQTFVPIGAVIGLFQGKYDKNSRIAGGQYNKDIDAKIADIKKTCGV